jgi:hypothetical protein
MGNPALLLAYLLLVPDHTQGRQNGQRTAKTTTTTTGLLPNNGQQLQKVSIGTMT